jgi:hypothetical protein
MSSRPHSESGRPLIGPLRSFDLGAEVAMLREGWRVDVLR